jgi:hypothetical protein
LVIAEGEGTRSAIALQLPHLTAARYVSCGSDTEGIGTEVVVIGGPFPLAELAEVRAHPQLFDKPVVLFAPGRDLPDLDWRSLNVWPVSDTKGATDELVGHVHRLLYLGVRWRDEPRGSGLVSPARQPSLIER